MTKSEMTCRNCIFLEKGARNDYCHIEPIAVLDEYDHCIDFPRVYNPNGTWCGQGEWEGVTKHDPTHKVLYRWGEWAA